MNHFSHPEHPLELYGEGERKAWRLCRCYVCGEGPSHPPEMLFPFGEETKLQHRIYGCRECVFFIHFSCAELPQWRRHPFHPQHSLSLYLVGSERLECHACGRTCRNCVYHCAECKFSLDRDCFELQLSNINEEVQQINPQRRHEQHEHPLFICKQPTTFLPDCSICRSCFYYMEDLFIYVCIECKNLLHESCVLPLEIEHPFHLEHPLCLQQVRYRDECSACSLTCYLRKYHCSECNFSLDLSCVSLKPTSRNSEHELQNEPLSLIHPHPLIECNPMKEKICICSGCDSPIEEFIYVCLKCGILLDKSCSQLLPEITHPFHPLHPLKLVKKPDRHSECRGCKDVSSLLTYECRQCDFLLDRHCASTKPYAMIKTRIHKHPIAFLTKKLHKYPILNCMTCGDPSEEHFFRCFECNDFYLHLKCYPFLPQEIKHDCHGDPLTLTRSPINAINEDSEELYCHACEDLRDLEDPTYYCKECYFVAHVQCVLSSIMHHLEAESLGSQPSSRPTTPQVSQFPISSEPSQTLSSSSEPTESLPSSELSQLVPISDEQFQSLASSSELSQLVPISDEQSQSLASSWVDIEVSMGEE